MLTSYVSSDESTSESEQEPEDGDNEDVEGERKKKKVLKTKKINMEISGTRRFNEAVRSQNSTKEVPEGYRDDGQEERGSSGLSSSGATKRPSICHSALDELGIVGGQNVVPCYRFYSL